MEYVPSNHTYSMFWKRKSEAAPITRDPAAIAKSNIDVMHDTLKYNGQILFRSGHSMDLEQQFGDSVKAAVAQREQVGDAVVGASIVAAMPETAPPPNNITQMPGNETRH